MSTKLVEATAVPQATSVRGRWRAVLVTPGQGSSAYYSEAVLRESGTKAFRKGAKSFVTHNRTENGEPDPFRMWGYLAEDATYEEGVGLVGEIQVLESWIDRVAEVAPHTALSLYASGNVDDDGNLTEFTDDRQTGIDLVVYPGRDGSGLVEKLYESAQNGTAAESSAQAEKKAQEKTMEAELKALTAVVESLAARFDAAEKRVTEAAEAEAKAALAEQEKFDAFAAADLISEAKLIPSLHKRVVEAVKAGQHDVASLIKDAQEIQGEITSLNESDESVQVNESGKPKAAAVASLSIFEGGK